MDSSLERQKVNIFYHIEDVFLLTEILIFFMGFLFGHKGEHNASMQYVITF